jgi:hypothetical protein
MKILQGHQRACLDQDFARKLQAESKGPGTSPNIRQQSPRHLPCPFASPQFSEKAYWATIVDCAMQTPDDEGNEIPDHNSEPKKKWIDMDRQKPQSGARMRPRAQALRIGAERVSPERGVRTVVTALSKLGA